MRFFKKFFSCFRRTDQTQEKLRALAFVKPVPEDPGDFRGFQAKNFFGKRPDVEKSLWDPEPPRVVVHRRNVFIRWR